MSPENQMEDTGANHETHQAGNTGLANLCWGTLSPQNNPNLPDKNL